MRSHRFIAATFPVVEAGLGEEQVVSSRPSFFLFLSLSAAVEKVGSKWHIRKRLTARVSIPACKVKGCQLQIVYYIVVGAHMKWYNSFA